MVVSIYSLEVRDSVANVPVAGVLRPFVKY